MESLDVLRTELEALGPQVEAADKKILAALVLKEKASTALETVKGKVRELRAVRDPLRIQQMQRQQVVGTLDGPPSQTISNGGE